MAKDASFIEVQFKANRKGIYYNPSDFEMERDDYVVVEAEKGEDLGYVLQKGRLVRIKCDKAVDTNALKKVIRPATEQDVEKLEEKEKKEVEAFDTCKKKIAVHNLPMKLVDVEFQFDKSKIMFYFTADQRVDFRELVKDLASIYRTRIELRQIGVRDEARRLGGFGICGLKQCCTSFINDFEQITTHMARTQQLSLNPTKISGNCGRLLCCLRYELGFYEETAARCPSPGAKVRTDQGEAVVEHSNIFSDSLSVRYASGEVVKVSCGQCKMVQTKTKDDQTSRAKEENGPSQKG